MKEKIAIIGGGIAGLTSAYLLNDKYDITLFEKDDRLGGNAYTLNTHDGEAIDISVFSFSKKSYKNFYKLLSELKIKTTLFRLSGMGVMFLDIDTKMEICVTPFTLNPVTLLKSLKNMIALVILIKKGIKLFDAGKLEGITTQEALEILPNKNKDVQMQMVFIICLVASMYYDEVLKAPATFFFGKLKYHFASLSALVSWRLIKTKTESYVNEMSMRFRENIVLNSKIKSVAREDNIITLKMEDGEKKEFNKVIFACNADQALNLIENPTEDEKRLLGIWKYKDGLLVVHKDDSYFPQRSQCNIYEYLYTDKDGKIHTSINGCYWHQKGVSKDSDYLGTQHPNFPIKEDLIEFEKVFRTPIYEPESFAIIEELPMLNGKMNSFYCGSHFGYGLHEDAVKSAIEVSKHFGVHWE